ncbi:hypothetical protein NHL51_01240 [Leucobacter sp. gxy201]|uniref:hypothetical protein n=1 Tax=Leucobacter sp. gxy201 TaxID=2957200 RepID=UPI003DA1B909
MTFPTTLIQIEAHPVECHRVQFDDIDEVTGRPLVSRPYGTREEALTAWASAGAIEADLITTDARIDAIRSLLHRLENAFAKFGSDGVTYVLAEHDFVRAQSRFDAAGLDLEVSISEADLR